MRKIFWFSGFVHPLRVFHALSDTSFIFFLFVTEAKASQNALEQLHVPRENQIASYYNIREELKMLSKQFQSYLTKPQYIVPFLQPGRLVKVRQ